MGLSGRYDFKGIQKAVGVAIDAFLASTSWGLWLIKSPFEPAIEAIRDFAINWLANHGLILLNLGAIVIDGKVDQAKLDAAINDGINRLKVGRDKISAKDGKAIDDEVRDAFDRDADVDATNAGVVSDVSASSLRDRNNPSI